MPKKIAEQQSGAMKKCDSVTNEPYRTYKGKVKIIHTQRPWTEF